MPARAATGTVQPASGRAPIASRSTSPRRRIAATLRLLNASVDPCRQTVAETSSTAALRTARLVRPASCVQVRSRLLGVAIVEYACGPPAYRPLLTPARPKPRAPCSTCCWDAPTVGGAVRVGHPHLPRVARGSGRSRWRALAPSRRRLCRSRLGPGAGLARCRFSTPAATPGRPSARCGRQFSRRRERPHMTPRPRRRAREPLLVLSRTRP